MTRERAISPGIYLVVDPSMEEKILLKKLKAIVKEEIAAVQIWDNFKHEQDVRQFINSICEICHPEDIPVLINNQWELLLNSTLDGVHFDYMPSNYDRIRKDVGRNFISGITLNNDLSLVKEVELQRMDYLSFCSVFSSSTSNSCDLVSFDTIKACKEMTNIPVFLAGGIKPENMQQLKTLSFEGVAVVSGIMSSDDPAGAVKKYINQLKNK